MLAIWKAFSKYNTFHGKLQNFVLSNTCEILLHPNPLDNTLLLTHGTYTFQVLQMTSLNFLIWLVLWMQIYHTFESALLSNHLIVHLMLFLMQKQ